MKWRVTIMVCLLFVGLRLHSQQFWAIEQYALRDGLPGETVMAVAKDSTGFLWVGGNAGLARFDGHRFTPIRPVFSDSLQTLPGQIIGLMTDAAADLWVSTRGGLYLCNTLRQHCEQIPLPEGTDDNRDNDWISPFFHDGNYAWATTSRHLVRIDLKKRSLQYFPLPRQQPTLYALTGICAGPDGKLWLTADYELYQFDPEKSVFRRYVLHSDHHAAEEAEAWAVLTDHRGRVWCGTRDHGLFRLNEQQNQFVYALADGLFVRTLALVNNEIWLGGGSKGLYRLPEGADTLADLSGIYPNGHNGSWANQVLYDSSLQLIWVGAQKGLEKIDLAHTHFQTHTLPITAGSAYPPFVLNVLEDKYMAEPDWYFLKIIENGVYHWSMSGGKVRPISALRLGKANECMVQDSRRRVWVNQYTDPKLQVYDARRQQLIKPPVPDEFLDCSYLYTDSRGDVWIGTFDNRVGRYTPVGDGFEEIRFFRSLAVQAEETDIVAISEDTEGRIWVLTDMGLYRLSADRLAVEPIDLSSFIAEGVFMLSLLATTDGHIWLGTREGAVELDGNGLPLRQFRSSDPLPLTYVYQIVEDARQQIWFGTSNGLYYTTGISGSLHKFDQQDGLLGANTYFLAGDRAGKIFVGFPAALNSLDTRSLPDLPAYAPPLAVTELRVLDKPRHFDAGQSLILRPHENFFTLRLGLLNYRQPAGNRYLYRLQGFEDQWHELDFDDHLTYTNLDGGSYTLEAKAVSSRHPDREYYLAFPLRVIPPFYKTAWFYALITVLFLSIAGAFLYNRQLQNRRLQMLRQRIARDLHDDVGSSLSSIRFFSEFIRQGLADKSPEAAGHLERISQSATRVTENMREIVWALQARSDGLETLTARIREYGSRLMESRNIRFSGDIDPAFFKLKMDIHHQRNLYLICKETFNNAAKYAACSTLNWEIRLKPGRQCMLHIWDDGKGFDPATVVAGAGLTSLHKRADEMNGRLEIISAPGQGTSIRLEWR